MGEELVRYHTSVDNSEALRAELEARIFEDNRRGQIPDFSIYTAQAFLLDGRGHYRLSQRGNTVFDANLWDRTVAGHTRKGESAVECIIRETGEEIGAEAVVLPNMSEIGTAIRKGTHHERVLLLQVDNGRWQRTLKQSKQGVVEFFWSPTRYIGVYDGPIVIDNNEVSGSMPQEPEKLASIAGTTLDLDDPTKQQWAMKRTDYTYDLLFGIRSLERELSALREVLYES